MRRYWIISLAIGGAAALAGIGIAQLGGFDAATEKVAALYRSAGWFRDADFLRIHWLEFLIAGLGAPAVALALIECTRPHQRLLVAGYAIGAAGLLSPTLALYGLLWSPFAPMAALALAAAGAALYSTQTETGRRKRFLEESVGSRVSAHLFNSLLEARESPRFDGATREVTTLVCRLLPDTARGRAATAGDLLKIGSLFQRTVSAFLLSRGAYLEETGPECIKASFGMLRDDPDHARRAARTACDLKVRLKGLSKDCESRWALPLRYGIGLATGTMAVGLCGTKDRHQFTGLGGDAAFADRLALANARLKSELLLGPETLLAIRDRFEVRPVEMLYDPDRQTLVEIYELLGSAESLSEDDRKRRDHFWTGVIHLRKKDFGSALEAFSQARLPGAEDAVLARLVDIVQEKLASPADRPSRLVRELTEEGHARFIQHL